MRALFCGGGTAGHVNPALAIAQTILRNSPSSEIAYVVTKKGIEKRLVPYKQYEIDAIGLKRSFSLSNVRALFVTFGAIQKSKEIIRDFRPDIVIGTGGYACYPTLMAASLMKIPTAVHESNVVAGKALKMLENRVDRIFVNFKATEQSFNRKDKIIHTGNPIREGFGSISKSEARVRLGIKEKYVVLCYGGSLGARAINEGALQLIENLIKENAEIRLVWASGKKEYKEMYYKVRDKKYDRLSNLDFCEYIYDMPEKIAAADVVICRAGAMSISEMAFSGKCTVFVPSPNVVDDHQMKNAQMLSKASSAILLKESEMFDLTDTVKELIENERKRNMLSSEIKRFCVMDSNKIIYSEIKKMIKICKNKS